MPFEIAVFLGEDGEPSSLLEKGKITVYQKAMRKWEIAREQDFTLSTIKRMSDLQKKMQEVLIFLHDCKIFVGSSVVGIPYYMLEKANCSIWECKGKPEEFLDYVLEKEMIVKKKTKKKKNDVQLGFIELSRGHYLISLKEIQEKNIRLTSKQVLQPFLKKGTFTTLEIICKHIPPWLEIELMSERYLSNTEKTGEDELKVVITKTY